jgi:hypothetical protein
MRTSTLAPSGTVALRAFRAPAPGVGGFLSHALPRRGLGREVNMWRLRQLRRTLPQFLKVVVACFIARRFGVMTAFGRLTFRVTRPDGTTLDYGIASYRVVTTAFVNYIVDALQADMPDTENFEFHGFGTGTNAEAAADTALQTELTTQYATDNTRPTGSQTESAANIYRTVGTLDPDSAVTIAEHGIFTQAATGGGTLMDRSQFTGIALAAAGDTLQATYDLTLTAGS